MVLAGEQVGGGEDRGLVAGQTHRGERPRRHRGLAGAHVALEQAEHRRGAGEVSPDRVDGRRLVGGELHFGPDLRAKRPDDRLPDPRLVGVGDHYRAAALVRAAAPSLDHAELEREQLVEREPLQGRVPPLERRGVVRLLDRLGQGHELTIRNERGWQVVEVRRNGPIERIAHRPPERDRGEPRGQPVHRHDPPDVEQLVLVALGLEVRVVEGPRPAEVLELARDDHPVARMQPALDVPPPEPRRLDRAGLILEDGDGPLDATPERRLDPNVRHGDPSRDDGPVLHAEQVAELAHLAQVVVPPGQVEQQVADGGEAHPPPHAPEHGCARYAGLRQRRIQERGAGNPRRGRRRSLSRRRAGGAVRAARLALPHPAYSAEIR